MPGAKKSHHHALPALFFLLLFSPGPPGVEGSPRAASRSRNRDPQQQQQQALLADRRTLLELLLTALRDSSGSSSPQAPSQPVETERVIVRRYTSPGGALYPSTSLDQEARAISSSSSRERVAGPRLFTSSRHLDVFSRDSDLKDKFIQRFTEVFSKDSALKDKIIQYFTGPVSFSAECSKLFYRLYHNTRDCSTPSYYKRCARLLTRLALSPQCTQS